MAPSNFFVQMPPDPFDRIGIGGIGRQEMEYDAVAPAGEILLDHATVMTAGVVTDNVNLAVAQQTAPQVFQVADKKRGAPSFLRQTLGDNQRPCAPVQRAGQI